MLSNTLFFLTISSGSVFGAINYNYNFEEILPITCMVVIILLFLSGIIGYLELGAVIVVLVVLLLYVASIISLKKNNKNYLLAFEKIFSPAFIIFLLVFLISNYALCGKLGCHWDEFSHWLDVVKVMTTIDDFATNPESYSMFKSYPPAMALFQYLLQKIYLFFNSTEVFCEWRAYLAYQTLSFSFLVCIVGKGFKNRMSKAHILLALLGIVGIPLFFFQNFLEALYIDPFLAILSSFGIGTVFLTDRKEKGLLYVVTIVLDVVILTLTKDAGILFAVFLVVLFLGDYYVNGKWLCDNKLKFISLTFVVCFCAIIPKVLWSWNIACRHAEIMFPIPAFSKLSILCEVVVNQNMNDYRYITLCNYFEAFCEKDIMFIDDFLWISYLWYVVLLVVMLYVTMHFGYRKKVWTSNMWKFYFITMLLQLFVYIFGMCFLYMFNFTAWEAVILASFERYINTILFSYTLTLFFVWMKFVSFDFSVECTVYDKWVKLICCSLILIFFACGVSKEHKFMRYLNRDIVRDSVYIRDDYSYFGKLIVKNCRNKSRVYIVSQATTGFDYLVLKYIIRPCVSEQTWGYWSVGKPFFKGDVFTYVCDKNLWMDYLLKNNYDYVALYKINDYFELNFSELFDGKKIKSQSLYYVDKTKKKLVLVAM